MRPHARVNFEMGHNTRIDPSGYARLPDHDARLVFRAPVSPLLLRLFLPSAAVLQSR